MSRHVRIRCPICGMLSWQSRLDEDWKFEVVIQHTTSRGRGRITHRYYHPEKQEGVWLIKLALIDKLEAVLRELKADVSEEQSAAFQELAGEGKWEEAFETLGVHHADFDEFVTSAMATLKGVKVKVQEIQDMPIEGKRVEGFASPGMAVSSPETFVVEASDEYEDDTDGSDELEVELQQPELDFGGDSVGLTSELSGTEAVSMDGEEDDSDEDEGEWAVTKSEFE